MNLRSLLLCACWLAWCGVVAGPSAAHAQVYKGVELVNADLLADTTAIAPGKPFTVGLRLKMAPHWHTYWLNSGDAGLATKITWTLPDGFKAGPIQWPVPEKIESAGDIINYGYSDEVVLLTEITPSAQLPPGETALKAKADWLVCAELCIPGGKELELKLPAAGNAAPANEAIFAAYQARLPRPMNGPDGVRLLSRKLEGSRLVFSFDIPEKLVQGAGAGAAPDCEFFPLPPENVILGHPTREKAPGYSFSVPITDNPADAGQVGGVLRVRSNNTLTGWTVPAQEGAAAPMATEKPVGNASAALPTAANVQKPSTKPAVGGVWHFLLLGLLGGLILNVMPCVLPVISLKVFSFIKQANDAPDRIFKLGLAYAAGVFAWFLGFAALIVILKAGGREVGYAFHLQSPWFVVGLSAAVFVFALNLLGVFEFVLPGAAGGVLTEASQRNEGYSGAFFQGVLATVLGSACTAPFFGAALGFAFAQSAPVVFAMFAAIALGMSLPFVLLTAFPQWLRFLPKPGAWMERVKQATGFLMLATLLWLLSILGSLRGADAVVWTGVLLLALGAACWVQGTFNTLVASDRVRLVSVVTMIALLVGGAWLTLPQIAAAKLPVPRDDFPAQLAAALKEENRPVFIDFTAAWCINCKFNERTVLATEPIQRALRETNAIFLTADYTARDPAIAKLLKKFGSPGVPLYVIYPADRSREPIVLPEILTRQLVLDGLKAAASPKNGESLASLDASRPTAERNAQ